LIARRQAAAARDIYAKIGAAHRPTGRRPQAAPSPGGSAINEVAVHCCMRYWHPMSDEATAAVQRFAPDEIVLLPLYPQFSSTTTASSYRAWMASAAAIGLAAPTKLVCCYPTEPGFIAAAASLVQAGLAESAAKVSGGARPVLLLACRKIVARGDPYPGQVAQSARAIAAALGLSEADWTVCFQSRVGPLEWIGPYTDEEIRRAGREGVPVVLFPIAFVSEHSETLVELDIDYRHLAEQAGVPGYVRVPTGGTTPAFIAGLAALVRAAMASPTPVRSQAGRRLCAAGDACCLNPA
jgi:ferrochelatase